MTLRTRPLTEPEQDVVTEIERLCLADGEPELWRVPWLRHNFSWSMAHRIAQRARIIHRASVGMTPREIAHELHIGVKMVRFWIKQFNDGGLAALADAARSGRPLVHGRASKRLVAAIRAVAYIPPPDLDLPFAHWSPARLARHLGEQRGLVVTPALLAAMLRFQDTRRNRDEELFPAPTSA